MMVKLQMEAIWSNLGIIEDWIEEDEDDENNGGEDETSPPKFELDGIPLPKSVKKALSNLELKLEMRTINRVFSVRLSGDIEEDFVLAIVATSMAKQWIELFQPEQGTE